ncbi:hypothetical protein MMP66_02265 [Acinetobacter dispersus]|uniref:hypothetical protein n=1 Tax=Acinetobacter dispersus TaxID=70348 RepID=UPI001F4B0C0A|nr:hypothetical protein [Acinetobacter dispersus]MCH7393102.1 hypothetical protein [Acinetobacter dispersus]
MYSHKKIFLSVGMISSLTLLSACGGDSSNSNSSYIPPKVMSEVKTDLKFLEKTLPSTQSTNVDTPVYRYTQIFNKENDQFKTSYRLEFDFDMNANTLYRLEADYDTLINAAPNSVKLTEFEKSGQSITVKKEFQCSKNNNPCANIVNSINMKTGQSKLDFNNLLLTKQYSVDGQINTITLAGSVEGRLTEAPTKVQLPTSQTHQLTLILPALTAPAPPPTSIPLPTQYEQLIFTNHNNVSIHTSYNKGAFEDLVTGSTSIYVLNNRVNSVYINLPNLPSYYAVCGIETLPCEGATYSAVNYQVTFRDTKINHTLLGIGYLNGSTGL